MARGQVTEHLISIILIVIGTVAVIGVLSILLIWTTGKIDNYMCSGSLFIKSYINPFGLFENYEVKCKANEVVLDKDVNSKFGEALERCWDMAGYGKWSIYGDGSECVVCSKLIVKDEIPEFEESFSKKGFEEITGYGKATVEKASEIEKNKEYAVFFTIVSNKWIHSAVEAAKTGGFSSAIGFIVGSYIAEGFAKQGGKNFNYRIKREEVKHSASLVVMDYGNFKKQSNGECYEKY